MDKRHADTIDDKIMRNEFNASRIQSGDSWAVDDIAGKVLDPAAVKSASALEIEYFHNM